MQKNTQFRGSQQDSKTSSCRVRIVVVRLAFPFEPGAALIHGNSIEMLIQRNDGRKIRRTSGPPLPRPLDAETCCARSYCLESSKLSCLLTENFS
jgi:hypothetical protein